MEKSKTYPRMSDQDIFQLIAEELRILPQQVQNTVELLDEENTIPFIARYRKEVTGKLNEEQIRFIQTEVNYFRALEERKQTVLRSIDEQGKLTSDLLQKIVKACKLQEVEDLYLPYRPRRKTRGSIAKARGLEPLADLMWEQKIETGDVNEYAAVYVNAEKEVFSVEEALQGAGDIVAERISDDAEVRQMLRKIFYDEGVIVAQAKDSSVRSDYEMYYDYKEAVRKIVPHRILAINRGETEGFLRVKIDVERESVIRQISQHVISNPKSIFIEHLKVAIEDSYDRLLAPSIERQVRSNITEKAEKHAIDIFARNLRNLLLQPPVAGKRIMGIDPGYRTGCKVAVIDETGKYLEGTTIFPHPPQEAREEAKRILWDLINKHYVDVIAIGNGTASRETELLVAEMIKERELDVVYVIVNEAGASVYSASPLAKEEFPDLDASMRGNISIARRLLDPLAELVKIDPKSIGVGLYQHDVNQKKLAEALNAVVESVVNYVGVNVNTASPALLEQVAGLNSRLAKNIVEYRNKNGKFLNRRQLLLVKGMGEKVFQQCAGFLRVPESDNLLDNTAIHPESYEATQQLLKVLQIRLDEIKTDSQILRRAIQDKNFTLKKLAEQIEVGEPTLEDIISNLEKPGRDPRTELPPPVFRHDVLKMEDLKEGMILKGTVRNVVDFGVFVDIGVKQDGLVHRSELNSSSKNPLDVVAVGQVVEVKVLKVDLERQRIALSMKI